VLAETQDGERADGVAWTSGATRRATVYSKVLTPLPAYGTRLRGIGFAEGDRPSRLVVELLNEFAGTHLADLLRLHPPDAPCRLVERLTDVAGGTRKGLSDLVDRLMAQIAEAPLGLPQQAGLAPLGPRGH